MKKIFFISVVLLVALLSVKQSAVLAEETPESMKDGFYIRIYERIESESQEESIKAVTKQMGISEEDIITIAQGGSIKSLQDFEGIAKVQLIKELNPDQRKIYLDLLAKQFEDVITGDDKYDEAFEAIQPGVSDRTGELIANREQLADEFAFEQSLVELEMELEEEVKAVEVFADGVLDDMSGNKDVDYSPSPQGKGINKKVIDFVKNIFGSAEDVEVEDIEELPRFDLIHDLEVIDYLIFGVGETIKLSPGGDREGGIGLFPERDSGGEVMDDNDVSVDGVTVVSTGDVSALPNSLNQPLNFDHMYAPQKPGEKVTGDPGLSLCNVCVSADLDYGPQDRLKILEESSLAENIAELFPNMKAGEGIISVAENLSEIKSLEDIGITSEDLEEAIPEDEFSEEECFTIDFDIIVCYKFEAGTYSEPKVFKNDNCISCHINKINEIFSQKLLPYSLKAKKNEGLIGGGGYCSGANDPEFGMEILLVPKPLNFYKNVCYPDPENDNKTPLDDPAKKIKEVQENYLKTAFTLQEQAESLYKDRSVKINQKREASGVEAENLTEEIENINLKIMKLEDKILTLRETNTLMLQQWRAFKENYEESTGCEYTVGANATTGFDDVLETYNKELKETIPSAHISESVESRMTERLLSLDPENIADVFDTVEVGKMYKEERYQEGKEIEMNVQKLSDNVEKVRMLGKEITEMTTHFRAFRNAMESLRRPEDSSVLKKLSEKKTP